MAQRSNTAAYWAAGGIAAIAGTAIAFLLRRTAPPTAPAPGGFDALPSITPMPAGGLPAAGTAIPDPATKPSPYAAAAGAAPTIPVTRFEHVGQTFEESPAPYYLVLYTVRWDAAHNTWGQWDNPQPFRGHEKERTSFGTPVYTSPEDDMIAYLDAITSSNPTNGYWTAYAVPVLAESADHTPTAVGDPGPWLSGRFGGVDDMNTAPELQWIVNLMGLPHSARVTQYIFALTQAGYPLPAEIALA